MTRDLVLAETAVALGERDADVGGLFAAVNRQPLGGVGSARQRADQAIAAGARPYVEVPQVDQARQWAEDADDDLGV